MIRINKEDIELLKQIGGKGVAIKAYSRFIKNRIIKTLYKKLFPSWIKGIKRELFECNTVLDLGCGYNSLIQYYDYLPKTNYLIQHI